MNVIDYQLVGDSLLAIARYPGRWPRPLPTEEDADAVVAYVSARLRTPGTTIERYGLEVVLNVSGTRSEIEPEPLNDDSGYGPDSYFGRAMGANK